MILLNDKLEKVSKEVIETIDNLAMVITMEECSELQKETSKMIRGKGNKDNLTEEIADVLICIQFLKEKYKIENSDIHYWLNKKTDRIKDKLSRGEFY